MEGADRVAGFTGNPKRGARGAKRRDVEAVKPPRAPRARSSPDEVSTRTNVSARNERAAERSEAADCANGEERPVSIPAGRAGGGFQGGSHLKIPIS